MHVELFVPALLARPGAGQRLPALELLLARARRRSGESMTLEARLLDAFGAAPDTLPAGALTVAAEGGDPGDSLWLRADPVHLAQQREVLVVMPPPAIRVARDEADAMVQALNSHFGTELELHAAHPERWCAKLAAPAALQALTPMQAAGRKLDAVLPGGDARRWHALMNEAQMLLHAHPANTAREARGEHTVNSLWFWGLGAAPAKLRDYWHSVSADDAIARGLGRLSGARVRALPAGADVLLAGLPDGGRHIVVLDALRSADALGDAGGWSAALAALEARWIAPLVQALRADRIGMITLHVPDADESRSHELVRGDLRRFWRRPRPL
ncbi:MAG: hypothetical protein AB7O31_11230 [Burkholderiales bacterium]